ncbi:hypothetical protein VT52_012595 [Streptomyces malaysiense]|uniref:Uncharacterized protein n=1 Tax=Streptomyces malaysiense TaxID=1428626 RepID=A0A1J4Q533_9ACTN|nr:hypothetical protein VT52_012595 [Streptomyces malaysiense]
MPAHVHASGVDGPASRGKVTVDTAFAGAMYAMVPAASVGLRVRPQDVTALTAVSREIRDGTRRRPRRRAFAGR